MAGSLRRADDNDLLSVLSPAALLALPGAATRRDPGRSASGAWQQHRRRAAGLRPADAAAAAVRPRAAGAAGDGGALTLPSPQVCASVLAGSGACVGVLEHAGEEVPVVDLPALCGLGRLERRQVRCRPS